jgi:surfactin family lipopeptide synthetase C/lichenysin synthetase C
MKLSDIIAAAGSEEREKLHDWLDRVNRTQRPYPRHRTVPQIFTARATENPEAVAVVCGPDKLSYGELAERAGRLASHLCGFGLEPGQLVAISLPRSAAAIVAMLATLMAGGAYLPISPDLPQDRVRRILEHSRAAFLIAEAGDVHLAGALPSGPMPSPRLVAVDRAGRTPVFDSPEPPARIDRSVGGSLAYVMYTSGTTGEPKGVAVEHQAILRLVINTNFIALGPSDCILQTGALAFDASTFEIWGALLNGGCLVLADTETWLGARSFARMVTEHRVTIAWLTAGVFNALVTEDVAAFAGLRVVLTGGERLSPDHVNRLRRALPDVVLINGYGPTENTTFTTTYEIREPVGADVPIGRPIANTSVYILNEQRQPVPVGEAGELYAGGDGLARGYLNAPDLTASRFVPHPFECGQRLYRTGDLARWRADGIIEFLGRADDQVKIRGFRVEPREIEAFMRCHSAIAEAIVVAKMNTVGDHDLIAYYTCAAKISALELRQHLRRSLPEYMIPAAFVELPKLPLTANGKVDRASLALPVRLPGQAMQLQASAVDDTQGALLAIWREVLERADFGTHDNFFDIGGHSMRAVRLAYRLEQSFGVVLPFTVLFEAPTIAELAVRLVEAAQFGDDRIDRPIVRFAGRGRPVFAFPPGTADALSYAGLAPRLEKWQLHAFNFIMEESRFDNYADLIEGEDPDGPYLLLGYSGGGNIAFRTAQALEARGRRVSALVMVDSSRFLRAFDFPEGEVGALALEFLGNEGVQPYIKNVALKDKVMRTIQRYHAVLGGTADGGTVDAAIDLILCAGSNDAFYEADGRLVCSKTAWKDATRGGLCTWQGSGDHRRMLQQPHLDSNAELMARILSRYDGE